MQSGSLLLTLSLFLAAGALAATASYTNDWDGNNNGTCPIQVNSGGGLYLRSGSLGYCKTESAPGHLYEVAGDPQATVDYEEFYTWSQDKTFRVRCEIVGESNGEWQTPSEFSSGWSSAVTIEPGDEILVTYDCAPSSQRGPFTGMYSNWECHIASIEMPPYPDAGQGYGYIQTPEF